MAGSASTGTSQRTLTDVQNEKQAVQNKMKTCKSLLSDADPKVAEMAKQAYAGYGIRLLTLENEKKELEAQQTAPLTMADLRLQEEEDADKVTDEMIRNSWYGEDGGGTNTGGTTASSSLSAQKPLTMADLRLQEQNDPKQAQTQAKSAASGGTRTLQDVYADLDQAN